MIINIVDNSGGSNVIYFIEVFVKEKLSKYIVNLSIGAGKVPGRPRSVGEPDSTKY